MPKKRSHINPRLIKSNRSYTFEEIAEVYGLHISTVRSWKKQGLRPIENSPFPLLFQGIEVIRFLNSRTQNRRKSLKPGEFNCTKCRRPRKGIPKESYLEYTGRNLGKEFKQVLIKGKCEICGTKLTLFSSDRIIAQMKQRGLFMELEKGLNGNESASLNTINQLERENVET